MKKAFIALVLLALVPSSALATASLGTNKTALVYGIKAREQQMTTRLESLLGELPSVALEEAEEETADELLEYTLLQRYDKGSKVEAIQTRLKALGFLTGKVDGDYGGGTTTAVKRFQEATNLQVTGTADVPTQKALFADDAPSAPVD